MARGPQTRRPDQGAEGHLTSQAWGTGRGRGGRGWGGRVPGGAERVRSPGWLPVPLPQGTWAGSRGWLPTPHSPGDLRVESPRTGAPLSPKAPSLGPRQQGTALAGLPSGHSGFRTQPNSWDGAGLARSRNSVATGLRPAEQKYQGAGITAPATCPAARLHCRRGRGDRHGPPTQDPSPCLGVGQPPLPGGPSWEQQEGRRAGPRPGTPTIDSCLGRPGPAPSRSTQGRPAGPRAVRDTRWPATFLQGLPAPTPTAANSSRKHILR